METLIEFRAGKMVLEGSQVRADPRKGYFRIIKGEAGLVHVQWLDRITSIVEDDQIVFPDEAVFEKVQQSNGRVYILKFKNDDRKLFFWFQEPRADLDEQLCISVNYYMNMSELDEGEEESGEESQPQAPVVDSGNDLTLDKRDSETGKATPAAVGAFENPNQPVQLADLQRILTNIGQSSSDGSSAFRDPGPSLSEVLKPDNIIPLLESSQLEERLTPYLPEGDWTLDAIVELMQSPQFRQQLDMFTHALRSGQMDLSQFGIDPSQCDFTVASFLEAIENQVVSKADNFGAKDETSDQTKQQDVNDMDE